MKASLPVAGLLVATLLVAGCATGTPPAWTYAPDRSTDAPATPTPAAVQASGSPGAGPTAPPDGSDASVVPALTPKGDLSPAPDGEVNVALAPNVPPPAQRSQQAIVDVHFDIVEGVQTIDLNTGTEYETWGYRINGQDSVTTGTPGPIIRARVGDMLRFTITNLPGNTHPHNVDFHAVTGQGGGAADTTVAPGETAVIEARLLYPGIFMYHCAYGDVPLHISQGMYGGILVDPAEPLPAVEHELYMVQSEYYTTDPQAGPLTTDRGAVTLEHPEYVVFNGAVGSLTGDNAPRMQVGESMRIYFVNAGLNLDSNFHPIGSHWDKVYQEGALLNRPLRGSQTTLVPAGGGTVVELIAQVPMTVVLVDHALARAFDKGAIGQIVIEGEQDPEIFEVITEAGPSGPGGPTSAPQTRAPATPSGTPVAGEEISIAAGSGNAQPMDAPDEFADDESPADYSVNQLMIALGTTVTWTNDDPGVMHTVTAADGSFDSGFLETGESFSYTFNTPGEFEYFCVPHPWMRARIVVMAN
jgi:nitrite reductase (NO-forming)